MLLNHGVWEELLLQSPQRVRAVGHELNLPELGRAVPAPNGLRLEPHEQRTVALERCVHPLVDGTRTPTFVELQRADDADRRHLRVLGLLPRAAPLLRRAALLLTQPPGSLAVGLPALGVLRSGDRRRALAI